MNSIGSWFSNTWSGIKNWASNTVNWAEVNSGAMLTAGGYIVAGTGVAALTVATGGLDIAIAGAAVAGGAAMMGYGGSDMYGGFTGYNPIRDYVYRGNYSAYYSTEMYLSFGSIGAGMYSSNYYQMYSYRTPSLSYTSYGGNTNQVSGVRTWQEANISYNDALRIQNAANRTGQRITVIGSRANGTASITSDWDYIMSGNSAQRHSAASSVPRGLYGGGIDSRGVETGIDIFTDYYSSPNATKLDTTRPYVIFDPFNYYLDY